MDSNHRNDANNQSVIFSEYENEPAISEILNIFTDSLPETLSDMRFAMQGGDGSTLASLAHQLKGAGGGYGYPVVSEAAAELEQLAKEEDWEMIGTTLVKLESICAAILRGRHAVPGDLS